MGSVCQNGSQQRVRHDRKIKDSYVDNCDAEMDEPHHERPRPRETLKKGRCPAYPAPPSRVQHVESLAAVCRGDKHSICGNAENGPFALDGAIQLKRRETAD